MSVIEAFLAFISILLAGFTIVGFIEVKKIRDLANKMRLETDSLKKHKEEISKEIINLKSTSIKEGKEILEILFYMTEGDNHKDDGNYEDAINYYKQALKVRKDNPEVYLKLGKLHTHNGEYSKAINFFEKGYNYSQTNIGILNGLGRAYRKMQIFDKAEFYYQKVLEIDKNYLWALSGLSMAYTSQKKYKDAEIILNEISQLEEYSFHPYMNLGIVHLCLKNSEESKDKFKEALRLIKLRQQTSKENNFWIDAYKSVILIGLNRYDEALKIVKRLINEDVRYNSMKSLSDRVDIIINYRKSSKLKEIQNILNKWLKK